MSDNSIRIVTHEEGTKQKKQTSKEWKKRNKHKDKGGKLPSIWNNIIEVTHGPDIDRQRQTTTTPTLYTKYIYMIIVTRKRN